MTVEQLLDDIFKKYTKREYKIDIGDHDSSFIDLGRCQLVIRDDLDEDEYRCMVIRFTAHELYTPKCCRLPASMDGKLMVVDSSKRLELLRITERYRALKMFKEKFPEMEPDIKKYAKEMIFSQGGIKHFEDMANILVDMLKGDNSKVDLLPEPLREAVLKKPFYHKHLEKTLSSLSYLYEIKECEKYECDNSRDS